MTNEFDERVPFSAVFSLKRGLNITRANYQKDGVPCLSYGDVHSRYLGFVDADVHSLPKVSASYIQTSPQCLLKVGDFVFADTSEDYEGVGNCTCVLNDSQGLFAGYHTTVASPIKKEICSQYYSYYFLSDDFRNQIRKEVTGIKVFSITNRILNATKLLSPGLNTQDKIATFLEKKLAHIDGLIVQKRELLKKLSEYRQSLITRAVTKGLNPNVEMKASGIEWIGLLPKSWSVSKLKWMATISSGGTPDRNNKAYWENGAIPWVKTGELLNDEIHSIAESITQEGLINSSAKMMPKGTVLVAMYGQGKTRGMAGLLIHEATTNQACACIIPNNDSMDSKFLLRLMEASYYFNREKAAGAGQPNINQEIIENLKFPCPPIEEQRGICEYLDKKLKIISNTTSQLDKSLVALEDFRSSLISATVTGKLSLEEVIHES